MYRFAVVIFVLAILFDSPAAMAQRPARLALLVGNQHYSEKVGPLRNPHKDTALVGKALNDVGFQIIKHIKDGSRDEMLEAVHEFGNKLRSGGRGALGFFYYTGHGVSVRGENVLVPVNATDTSDMTLSVKGVKLSDILDVLKREAPDAVHFVVLDACRNNIRGQRGSKGFAPVIDQRTGFVIAFATAAGDTASDEGTDSGPYAEALAAEIVRPGQTDQQVFNAVRAHVVAHTRVQTPWTHDGLVGDRVVFKSTPIPELGRSNTPTFEQQAELALWESVRDGKDPAMLQVYLNQFPTGIFAELAKLMITQAKQEANQRVVQATREAEARNAEAAKSVAEAQRVEAEQKARDAEAAKHQAQLRHALQEAKQAQEALQKAERNRLAAEKAADEARQSAESMKRDRETHVAAAQQWATLRDTTDLLPLEIFIKQFGQTTYGDMARIRMDQLKKLQGVPNKPLAPAKESPPQRLTSPPTSPLRVTSAGIPKPSPAPGSCNGIAATVAKEQRCLKVKDAFKDCENCPEMIVLPAGQFVMGAAKEEGQSANDERPQRKVLIPHVLAVGRFEVTFEEWAFCVSANGCNRYTPTDRGWGRGRMPVFGISWEDGKAYVAWLATITGERYRLLSEAEWEYAARAGSLSPYAWGGSINVEQANYNASQVYGPDGRQGEYRRRTVPVDSFNPNAFGLYQMHGNVLEWVEDCWHTDYAGAPLDGTAWVTGGSCSERVLRGGSFVNGPARLRSSHRYKAPAASRADANDFGLRVARSLH